MEDVKNSRLSTRSRRP